MLCALLVISVDLLRVQLTKIAALHSHLAILKNLDEKQLKEAVSCRGNLASLKGKREACSTYEVFPGNDLNPASSLTIH